MASKKGKRGGDNRDNENLGRETKQDRLEADNSNTPDSNLKVIEGFNAAMALSFKELREALDKGPAVGDYSDDQKELLEGLTSEARGYYNEADDSMRAVIERASNILAEIYKLRKEQLGEVQEWGEVVQGGTRTVKSGTTVHVTDAFKTDFIVESGATLNIDDAANCKIIKKDSTSVVNLGDNKNVQIIEPGAGEPVEDLKDKDKEAEAAESVDLNDQECESLILQLEQASNSYKPKTSEELSASLEANSDDPKTIENLIKRVDKSIDDLIQIIRGCRFVETLKTAGPDELPPNLKRLRDSYNNFFDQLNSYRDNLLSLLDKNKPQVDDERSTSATSGAVEDGERGKSVEAQDFTKGDPIHYIRKMPNGGYMQFSGQVESIRRDGQIRVKGKNRDDSEQYYYVSDDTPKFKNAEDAADLRIFLSEEAIKEKGFTEGQTVILPAEEARASKRDGKEMPAQEEREAIIVGIDAAAEKIIVRIRNKNGRLGNKRGYPAFKAGIMIVQTESVAANENVPSADETRPEAENLEKELAGLFALLNKCQSEYAAITATGKERKKKLEKLLPTLENSLNCINDLLTEGKVSIDDDERSEKINGGLDLLFSIKTELGKEAAPDSGEEQDQAEEGKMIVEEFLDNPKSSTLTAGRKAGRLLDYQEEYGIERDWFLDNKKIDGKVKELLKQAWNAEDNRTAAPEGDESQPEADGTPIFDNPEAKKEWDDLMEEIRNRNAEGTEAPAPEAGEPIAGEENMTPEQRREVRAGLAGIGFYARKYKSQAMAYVLNRLVKEKKMTDENGQEIVLDISDRSMMARFTKSMAETYEKDAARAQRGLDDIVARKQSGKGAGIWNTTRSLSLAVGMATKLTRTVMEISGSSVLLPRRYIMMGAMGTARGMESLKEARFKGKELKKKTEEINFEGLNGCHAIIEGAGDWADKKAALENLEKRLNLTDSEKEWIKVIAAFKEAKRDENGEIIQHLDVNGGLTDTSISDAYKKMYGEKSYKRLTGMQIVEKEIEIVESNVTKEGEFNWKVVTTKDGRKKKVKVKRWEYSQTFDGVLDKSREILAKSVNSQVEKYLAKVAKKIKKIEDSANLSEEEKQSQKEAVLVKYQEQLQEYDKMVTQFGEVDGWAMGFKQAERISKAAVTALTLEALALGAFSIYDNFLGHQGELGKIAELEDKLAVSRAARTALTKELGLDFYKLFGYRRDGDQSLEKLRLLKKAMPSDSWKIFQGEIGKEELTDKDRQDTINLFLRKFMEEKNPAGTVPGVELGSAAPTEAGTGDWDKMIESVLGTTDTASTPATEIENPGAVVPTEAGTAAAITDKQIELATIHKGDGIEKVLIRQLKDPEIAKKFGWDGKGSLSKWAGVMAHQIAIKTGYVDAVTNAEVRVGSGGIDKVAYVLSGEGDNFKIDEYVDGKSVEENIAGKAFEGGPGRQVEDYEYVKGAAKAAKKAAGKAVEEAKEAVEPAAGKTIDGTDLVEKNSQAFENINNQPLIQNAEPGQAEVVRYAVDFTDANGDGIPEKATFRLGNLSLSEEIYEPGEFADAAAFEAHTRDLGERLATAGKNIDQVAEQLGAPGDRTVAADFISQAMGSDVKVDGFDYSEGVKPGSAFETLIKQFADHRDLFIDGEKKIDPTQFRVFQQLSELKIGTGRIVEILGRTRQLDNLMWQGKEEAIAKLMAEPKGNSAGEWIKELFGSAAATESARAATGGNGITFSNISGKTVSFNFKTGIIRISQGLEGVFGGGETFDLDQINDVTSRLSSD